MSRNSLISLLAALCLLYSVNAEAKRDTQSEHSSNVAELQTKAAQGFVKQELELAAAYFAGRGVPKISLRLPIGIARRQIREIPPHRSISVTCIPSAWACPRIRLKRFDGTGVPHLQTPHWQK